MELATALIWTLRIVLPIFLFCIYFKLQAPKDEQYAVTTGSSKNSYSRGMMLAHRRAILDDCPVPEVLSDLTLKDQSEAPALFAGGGGAGRAARPGQGGRRDSGAAPRERRERRNDRGEDRRGNRRPSAENDVEDGSAGGASPHSTLSPTEEKMHLESLLNYVAFNRKDQQRNFLPDERSGPPPPPPKPRKSADGMVELRLGSDALTATAEKANAEAQMVLRGAVNFKRSDVARDLYLQLVESNVEVNERTFALMIDACILARDFKSASDFLMKMESAGYCPDSELLDKVMDLYSQQKLQREQEKKAYAAMAPALDPAMNGSITMAEVYAPPVEEASDGPRAKLSSDAPIFVPSFSVPPAESTPQESAPSGNGAAADGSPPPTRTKLTSSAKPFEPQFGFDPYMYAWPVEQGEEAGAEGQKGKAKGRGNGWKEEEDGDDEASPNGTSKAKARGRRSAHEDSTDRAESGKAPKAKAKAWRPKNQPDV